MKVIGPNRIESRTTWYYCSVCEKRALWFTMTLYGGEKKPENHTYCEEHKP